MRIIRPYRRRGFTLIELMLAMALGIVIVFTAFAGIRVASQCYTISSRLSLENSMLRTGFMKALEELDFWNSYDDPFDSSTTFGSTNGGEVMRNPGLPFCPFATAPVSMKPGNSLPLNGDGTTMYLNESGGSVAGWYADYSWPMSDPAVWCRVNMGESCSGKGAPMDMRFGYYGMFSGTYPSFSTIPNYTPNPSTVPHQWLSNQMEALKKNLGYYGMIEYLPANTIYAYNTYKGAQGANPDGLSKEMSQPGGGPGWFADGDGGTQSPRGLYRDNKDVSFGIFPTNPMIMYQPWNQGGSFNGGIYGAVQQQWNTGQYTNTSAMQDFQNRSMTNTPLMPAEPITWPGVATSVERFVTYDRFAAVMRVRLTNAITGQHLEFNFSGFGTSLRGARQQRNQSAGGGWAIYDNDALPSVSSRNTATLDTP
jgi:prepilin-type N-terminal cleavage/methylation domain-containing protein